MAVTVDGRARAFATANRIIGFSNFLHICHRSCSSSMRARRSRTHLLPPLGGKRGLRRRNVATARHFARRPPHCARTDLIHGLRRLNVKHPSACTPAVSAVRRHRCIVGKRGTNRRHACGILGLRNGRVASGGRARVAKTRGSGLVPASANVIIGSFLVRCFPSVLSCGFATDIRGRFSRVTRNSGR